MCGLNSISSKNRVIFIFYPRIYRSDCGQCYGNMTIDQGGFVLFLMNDHLDRLKGVKMKFVKDLFRFRESFSLFLKMARMSERLSQSKTREKLLLRIKTKRKNISGFLGFFVVCEPFVCENFKKF